MQIVSWHMLHLIAHMLACAVSSRAVPFDACLFHKSHFYNVVWLVTSPQFSLLSHWMLELLLQTNQNPPPPGTTTHHCFNMTLAGRGNVPYKRMTQKEALSSVNMSVFTCHMISNNVSKCTCPQFWENICSSHGLLKGWSKSPSSIYSSHAVVGYNQVIPWMPSRFITLLATAAVGCVLHT